MVEGGRGSDSKTAYKFLPPERIDVLERRLIRFTPPDGFNDPFEALPKVTGPNLDTLRRHLAPDEDIASFMASADQFFPSHGPELVLRGVSAEFGALCLAAESRDPLLWAHYAGGHTGFALGFDISHDWFRQSPVSDRYLDSIEKMTYDRERPSIPMLDAEDVATADLTGIARAMFFTKHSSWAYEREWRLVRPLERADRTITAQNGRRVHLFEFPADSVSELIVGARATSSTLKGLRAALAIGGLEHIRFRAAQVSATSFDLDITDMPFIALE